MKKPVKSRDQGQLGFDFAEPSPAHLGAVDAHVGVGGPTSTRPADSRAVGALGVPAERAHGRAEAAGGEAVSQTIEPAPKTTRAVSEREPVVLTTGPVTATTRGDAGREPVALTHEPGTPPRDALGREPVALTTGPGSATTRGISERQPVALTTEPTARGALGRQRSPPAEPVRDDPPVSAQVALITATLASPVAAEDVDDELAPELAAPISSAQVALIKASLEAEAPSPAPARLRLVREEPAPESLALPEALRLERNLALLAGAGTGKTYSLVTMCLHLLGGARAEAEPIAPERLGLLTFTDKAAAEMRERLRRRLDALADGQTNEPELLASFEALGAPMPPARFWRRIRDDLGAATIGTFHSLCTHLLRRAPAGSGVNPGFALLDEREARALLQGVIEREVLRRIEAKDPLITDLVRELQFGGGLENGLIDGLVSVFVRLREEGSQPRFLRITDPIAARREFERTLAEVQALTRDGIQRAYAKKPKENDKARAFAALLNSTSFESYPTDAAVLQELSGALKNISELREARTFVSDVKDSANPRRLDWLHAAVGLAPYEAAIRDLLGEVMRLHEQALKARGVLDFTGMLLQARNLLRDVPTARLEAQTRFGALLVDEFQDTNRVQLELVMFLAEKRQGAPRPISESLESASQEVLELPLQRAFLAVVGDRKQGIYEFRGADVTVFEEMARRIEASGGGRAWLQTSWRSSPALVASLNTLMLRVLAKEKFEGAPRAFEVVYTEQDHLQAQRGHVEGTPIVRLTATLPEKPDAATLREFDADAVARFVRQRLSEGTVRGADIAMLFQRLTQLETYRLALVRHGVRHRVVRGRGFFGAQEVVDLACWLKLLATPGDALALATVLRSPLVGLRDASLVRLAQPTRGLDAHRVLLDATIDLTGLSPDEVTRFERFRTLFATLLRERDRLGLRALVRVTLDTLEVREALAAGPFGEQALANVEKLLELATTRQNAGIGAGAFAQELLQLAQREPREAQGDVLDAYDPEAVTLCTVHQAKGLEWPIVVLPELFAARRNERELIWFDRNEGLAIRPFGMPESITGAAREKAISSVRNRRAFAENLRLLYVAMTRARDQVVLGLMAPKVGDKLKHWADVLQNDSWNDVTDVQVDSLPEGAPPVDPLTAPASATEQVRQIIERVRQGPSTRPVEAVLPVTQLQDFVSCPRRFHFAHQVGLAERPRSFVADEEPGTREGAGGPVDVRARGTAAHRLLELTPLDAVGSDQLMAVLRDLRRAEDLPDDVDESVLRWVHGFWASPAGRRIASLGESRVHRELPFVLPLRSPSGDFTLHLRGQIDLVIDGPEGLEVLDYKTSRAPPAGLGSYAFQLGCYAVAAAALLADERPVRAGLVFLRDDDPSPRFLPSVVDAATLRSGLVAEARALTTSQITRVFEGRPLETCRALGCGYVYRCHPDAA